MLNATNLGDQTLAEQPIIKGVVCDDIIDGCKVLVFATSDSVLRTYSAKNEIQGVNPKFIKTEVELGQKVELNIDNEQIKVEFKDDSITVLKASATISARVISFRERGWDAIINTKKHRGHYVMRSVNSIPENFKFERASYIQSQESVTVTLEYTSGFPHVFLHILVSTNDSSRPFKVFASIGAVDGTENIDYFIDLDFSPSQSDHSTAEINFFTDSNGLTALRRTYNKLKPIEDSIYPIASFATISINESAETKRFVSILSDRATGVTSRKLNSLSVMFQRRNFAKDYYGLREGVVDHNSTHIELGIVFDDTPHRKNLRLAQLEDDTAPLQFYLDPLEGDLSHIKQPKIVETGAASMPPRTRVQLDLRADGFMARLYNMDETDSWVVADIEEFLKTRYSLRAGCRIDERSVDYNRPIHEVLDQDGPWGRNEAMRRRHQETTQGKKVTLLPLSYRTFRIRCHTD